MATTVDREEYDAHEYERMRAKLDRCVTAPGRGGRSLSIGTLPTLRSEDLGGTALTDEPRYQALDKRLRTWNRPIYDLHAGGHLRVELRALPAGPTSVDMAADGHRCAGGAAASGPGARRR